MVFAWTKQFLIATGLFALILTGQTVNLMVKDQQIAKEQMKEAQKTAQVKNLGSQSLN